MFSTHTPRLQLEEFKAQAAFAQSLGGHLHQQLLTYEGRLGAILALLIGPGLVESATLSGICTAEGQRVPELVLEGTRMERDIAHGYVPAQAGMDHGDTASYTLSLDFNGKELVAVALLRPFFSTEAEAFLVRTPGCVAELAKGGTSIFHSAYNAVSANKQIRRPFRIRTQADMGKAALSVVPKTAEIADAISAPDLLWSHASGVFQASVGVGGFMADKAVMSCVLHGVFLPCRASEAHRALH